MLMIFSIPLSVHANNDDDILQRLINDRDAAFAERDSALNQRDTALNENKHLREQLEKSEPGDIRLISPHNISLDAGESREITITLRNVGSQAVQNLFTLASPSNNAPFSVEFLRNTNTVSSIGANLQRTMTLLVTVEKDAEPGTHAIALEHFFRDAEISKDIINVRIGGTVGTPNVRLGSFKTNPTGTLSQDTTFTVSANIQNQGTATARDVRVLLPDNARPANGIFITSDLNQSLFSAMEADFSREINFTFQTAKELETGAYTIDFHVSYGEEGKDGRVTEIFPLVVNIFSPDEEKNFSNLEIREINTPTQKINVGANGKISFKLFNSGDVEARNIRVEAAPDNDAAIVPMTANVLVVPNLAPGESREVAFNFSPTRNARSQSYTVRFRTTFELGRTGETSSFDQFAAFSVNNPDEDDDEPTGMHIPRVIISSHKLEPQTPRAGDEFEMAITFRNTSNTLSINNMRVLIAEQQQHSNIPGQQNHFAGLTPSGGSNTHFIENLAPRGETTIVLRFTTSADATPGTHNMRISYDFQDQNFKPHEDAVTLSFQLAQFMRLELANVNVPENGSLGSPAWFSFRIINSGRVNLSNMRIETEGAFDVTDAGRFITPINAQRFAEFDGRFTPLEAGIQEGKFIVRGEDNTGESIEFVHTFTIFVDEGFGFEGGDWGGAWGDDFGGGRLPSGGRDVWHEPFEDEKNNSNAIVRFVKKIFTREVAPEWWDVEFMGEFNSESAAMMGVEPETETRWVILVCVVGLLATVIFVPIILLRKKRSKLIFDDED